MKPLIQPLAEATDVSLVGGKAASLCKLINTGFKVPPGFVVTTEAFNKMDSDLKEGILENFDNLKAKYIAVRSSAVAEDSKNASWAGQFDSFLNIGRSELLEKIHKCWDSANSERATAYAKDKKLQSGPVAVIVQAMVPSDVAGVAFSVHPVTNDRDQIVIEAVRGLGEQLVSGSITPDTYVVKKSDLIISSSNLSGEMPILEAEKVSNIAKQAIWIEKLYSFPVDVEWAIAKNQLYILQSRPITTLG